MFETAEAVVVGDDLSTRPAVIDLSRRARRVLTANFVFAGIAIVSLVVVDPLGYLRLLVGVVGHEGSLIVVVLMGCGYRGASRGASHRSQALLVIAVTR